tara:strand:- start:1435 stop:1611 length:177 start_codon:yes stop_codon:yes gene_type:complete
MAKKVLIIEAILSLDNDAKVEVTGSDIDTCDIYWESTEISKADIKAEQQRLQDIEDGK